MDAANDGFPGKGQAARQDNDACVHRADPMKPFRTLGQWFRPRRAAAEQTVAQAAGEGGAVVIDPAVPLFNGEPIPTYPNRGVAVPAVAPQMLIQSQRTLVDRLHQMSSFSYAEFDALIRPAIHNYAAYAHLLPASESNHHCGQGGLFRHGLEVACNAAMACENKVFAMDRWASERHHLTPRWRMCAILGGMMHDMGKPLIDVGAIDASGEHQWNPHTGSLWDWLQQHQLEHYYIHWRPGARFKRHEAFTNLALYRIVPQPTLDWIDAHGGQEAFDAMVMALTGAADPQNPLSALIRQADSKSVDRDIKDSRQRLTASGMGGQRSLALRLARTIHDTIEAGTWVINKVGSPVWFTTEGVFGFYPDVLNHAIATLRSQGETGLPTDASKALDVLADWGYLHPRVYGSGESTNTWNVRIHATDRGKPAAFDFQFLRFAKDDILPGALLPPTALPAQVLGLNGEPVNEGGVVGGAAPISTHPEAERPGAMPGEAGAVPPEQDPPAPPPAATESPSTAVADADATAVPPLRDRSKEQDIRGSHLDESRAHFERAFPPVTPEDAMAWLSDPAQQPEGDALIKLAQRLQSGVLTEGTHVFDVNERIYLKSPDAFKDLGWSDPADVRERLVQRGWTEKDSPTAQRTTVTLEHQGKRIPCARLTETLTTVFRLLMPARAPARILQSPSAATRASLPLGPRIDATIAARLQSTTTFDAADGPLIRPILHAYLLEVAQEQDIPIEHLSSNLIHSMLNSFIRMHGIRSRGWYLQHVLSGPVPVCLSQAPDRSSAPQPTSLQTKHELRINPAYDPAPDHERAAEEKAA